MVAMWVIFNPFHAKARAMPGKFGKSMAAIEKAPYVTGASPPGPRLNIKTVLSTYGDFHVKDKTAVRTSYL